MASRKRREPERSLNRSNFAAAVALSSQAELQEQCRDYVLPEGQQCRDLAPQGDLDDNTTIVQSLNEGDLFGHIAVIEHCPHTHSVRAVRYSECTSLDQPSYLAIAKESEKFEELITMEVRRHIVVVIVVGEATEPY